MASGLRLRIVADDSAVLKSIAGISTKLGGVTRGVAGMGSAGKAGFGGLAAAMSASGLPDQFSSLTNLLGGASQGFDALGKKKINLGSMVTGAGVGIAALGGVGEALASPLEAAKAQLNQSISNAHQSAAAFAKPIGDQQKNMQSLGFTYTDTDSSLSKLVQGFGSTSKALQEEGLVADIAARNHTSLSASADIVVKAFAKSPMVLKQFGINTADITKTGKDAGKAQKDHGKAVDDLAKKQQAYSQLQQRLGASGTTTGASSAADLAKKQLALSQLQQRLGAAAGATGAASAAAVVSAQNAVAAAGTHLQDVHARVAAGTLTGASAAAQLTAAQDRVTTATARLDGAQAKAAQTGQLTIAQQQELTNAQAAVQAAQGKTTGLTVAQSQELTNAQAAVQAAQTAVTTTGDQATKTQGDLNNANLTGQQILDMLAQKTHGLAKAQAATFGGTLRRYKADVEDFGATYGAKYGKVLIMSGPLLAASGTLIESGFFGKIGRGVGKMGGWVTKLLGFGGAAEKVGTQAAGAAPGIEGMGGAAEGASGKVAGVGAAAATAAPGIAGTGDAAATATPGVEGLGTAAATAAPGTEGLGTAAGTSAPEVERLGGAAATATPEIAAEGAAADTAAAGETAMGAGGAKGVAGAGAGAAKGLSGVASGAAAAVMTPVMAAIIVDALGRVADRFLPGDPKNPATWKGAGTEVFGHPAQAAKDLLGGGPLSNIKNATAAATSTKLGPSVDSGASLSKVANSLAAQAAHAVKTKNLPAELKAQAAISAEFAKHPHGALSKAAIKDPTNHMAEVMNHLTEKFLSNQGKALGQQIAKATPKKPPPPKTAAEKAHTATTSVAATLKALQAKQASLEKVGTAAQTSTTIDKLTAALKTEKAGSPDAKATQAQIHTLSDHMRDLANVSGKIATDQHTAAGLQAVQKAITTHPTVAKYDQSMHVTITNAKIEANDPASLAKNILAEAHRANFSGEGSPLSTSGG
jgi:hypothetical protein